MMCQNLPDDFCHYEGTGETVPNITSMQGNPNPKMVAFWSWSQHACMTFSVSSEVAMMMPSWPSWRETWIRSSRLCAGPRHCSSPASATAWSVWTASVETRAGEIPTCTRWSRCSVIQWTRSSPMPLPICSTCATRTTASSRRCASWTECRCWWHYWTILKLRFTARRVAPCATYPTAKITITKWPSRTVKASQL